MTRYENLKQEYDESMRQLSKEKVEREQISRGLIDLVKAIVELKQVVLEQFLGK